MSVPTVDELANRLGMSASDIAAFKKGNVVTEEQGASNEKDLCLLVCVKVPAGIEKAWQFVINENVADIQKATLSQGHINLNTFELEGFQFDHGTKDNITQYAMSKAESNAVSRAADKQKAFKEVLSARAKAYWQKGLEGIEPYDGKNHNIGDDLATANNHVLKAIHDTIIRQEITTIPAKSQNPDVHSLIWTIVQGNSISSIVLCHLIRYKKGDQGFVSITRKFYSGVDFDASMITTGVLPTSQHESAVFYMNHTFTAAVAGFGGGTKRNIGRKMMKGALVETMEKAKKALA